MDVSNTEQLHIVFRLLIAGGLGAFVGLEREVRGYPAGIRTIALVAMGAALFTDMSVLFADQSTSRVAAQIVIGVGFIGGGVIMQERGGIHGMTTAATIWGAAAIGMATGLSLYIVACATAVFMFLLLEARTITRPLDGFLARTGIEPEDDSNQALPPDETKRRGK